MRNPNALEEPNSPAQRAPRRSKVALGFRRFQGVGIGLAHSVSSNSLKHLIDCRRVQRAEAEILVLCVHRLETADVAFDNA
jgi:hypothetical protein